MNYINFRVILISIEYIYLSDGGHKMSLTVSAASRRIISLLDANSFVEIGGQVTARSTDFNLSAAQTPSDGVITGYGTIDGSLVYIYSQDASVLGGTVGEMHARKISRIYHLACKTGAPVIGLIDCGGRRNSSRGVRGRTRRTRTHHEESGHGVRPRSPDHGNLRLLRRRPFCPTRSVRFHIYGN